MLIKITSKLITTHIFLNAMSCLMGFFAWYAISNSLTVTRVMSLPLYFDNTHEAMHVQAPEEVVVTLAGTRSALMNSRNLGAVHVDSKNFTEGKKILHATYQNFLLPSAVKVINYNPIEVTITPIKTSQEL